MSDPVSCEQTLFCCKFYRIFCQTGYKINPCYLYFNSTQNGICIVPFDGEPPYNELIKYKGGCKAMNIDKIYAESLANEYTPKDTAKVVALKKLDIAIGIIGFAGMGINYPVYRKMLEKGKQKYAFEIVELAREISENM